MKSVEKTAQNTAFRRSSWIFAFSAVLFSLSLNAQAYSGDSSGSDRSHPHSGGQVTPVVPGGGQTPSTAMTLSNLDTCFSPDEPCDQKLITLISAAHSTLEIAIYSITHQGIAQAIANAKARGVNVRMVVDRKEAKAQGSAVQPLVSAGIPLKMGNVRGIMHNKFTIVDGIMVETGSFNYSVNATSDNAENQIYLTDANVIQRYQGEFEKLWANGLSD